MALEEDVPLMGPVGYAAFMAVVAVIGSRRARRRGITKRKASKSRVVYQAIVRPACFEGRLHCCIPQRYVADPTGNQKSRIALCEWFGLFIGGNKLCIYAIIGEYPKNHSSVLFLLYVLPLFLDHGQPKPKLQR